MSQLARKDVSEVQEAPMTVPPTSMLEVIARAASDPNTDAEKMARLLDMYERITAQQARAAFNRAMVEMKPKLPTITEKGGIKNNSGEVQSTYAKFEDIDEAISPILHEYGFGLSFRPGIAPDGKQMVTAILRHIEGHEDEATVTLPYDSSGNKNGVQAVGSSLSYGKRYAAIAILNITSRAAADRDDNGDAAGTGTVAQKAITEINMAETADELRTWKAEKFAGVEKMVSDRERNDIVALWNRRMKNLKPQPQAAGADFPGDR